MEYNTTRNKIYICYPNNLTFLASLIASELTDLFNKLALEYCSAPSPLAIAKHKKMKGGKKPKQVPSINLI